MSLQDEINRLEKEKQAIVAEFKESATTTSPEKITKSINDLAQTAITQLDYFLKHCDSDSIRWNATKYVLEITRNPSDPNNPDNALSTLIKELSASKLA